MPVLDRQTGDFLGGAGGQGEGVEEGDQIADRELFEGILDDLEIRQLLENYKSSHEGLAPPRLVGGVLPGLAYETSLSEVIGG